MGKNIVFGAKKDKFDTKARYHIPKVVRIPDRIDLSQNIPQIGDQNGCGKCTGFGFGGGTCTVASQLGYIQPKRNLYHSVDWIYNGGRRAQGWLNEDNGAYPDDCANWIIDYSLLPWSEWPCKDELDTTDPIIYKDKVIQYIDRTKYRVDNGVEGIISALSENHPVCIGIPWASSWMSYSSGVLPKINGSSPMAGGHEVFLWAYDKIKGTILGSNSWGTDWGINIPSLGTKGGFEMDMEVFEIFKQSFGGYDAHYLTFNKPNTPSSQLISISLEPKESSIVVGNKTTLIATGNYANGETSNITNQVNWSVDNWDYVVIKSSGEIIGRATGKVNIYASIDNIQSNVAVVEILPKQSGCNIGKKLAKIPTPILAALGRNGRFYYMDSKIKDANKK